MIIPLIFLLTLDIERSFAEDLPTHEAFSPQSVSVFSVVDSSVGIFEDPVTKLLVVDLGTFYGIGGNGTIPDTIHVYRDDTLWKTTTKETGIAPSTSHSEWQLPQTFFFNELPGKYKLVLITNNTETLVYEFLVKQIVNSEKNNLIPNLDSNHSHHTTMLPPLKQIANGVLPKDIVCKENYELIFKITNNSPACVTLKTAEKLLERGWILN